MSDNSSHSLPNPSQYAEVVVDVPVATALSYRIPEQFRGHLAAGQRVWAPLRDRRAVGCVVGVSNQCRFPRVKSLYEVIDPAPVLPEELLALSRWVAETYCATWGEALYAMLPGPLRRGRTAMTSRTPWQPPTPTPSRPPPLTDQQVRAIERVREALEARRHEMFLLHGVTGSGKTEVYLHAISQAVQQGAGCIVLVPEIALTPQTIERFTARFGPDLVAVLHSAMRDSHRLQAWYRVARGQARVVIGARSAVFAPVHQLGLIVVDEEHESTYKQDDAPRYHAREVAVARGRLAGGVVILGSATPSLESYYRAKQGAYTLLTLTERVDHQPMPSVQIVDMRRQPGRGRPRIFSHQLETALIKTLADRQQAILFLNRRGFSTFIHCTSCGAVARCPSCQVALTFHQASGRLLCHYCRTQEPVPEICPACRGNYVRFHGTGTQRVESELARLLPTARLARMDTDAMRPRGSHEAVLARFRRGEIDVLIGTQMVAKGHDFPQVTLIGVISADTALNLPDFRAGERTFELLTQVAGRAGRGTLPGRVVVQTYVPNHEAIVAAAEHDYETFYRQEMIQRRALGLPPVAALAQMTVKAYQEATAKRAAEAVAGLLQRTSRPAAVILGPAPAHISRIRRQYRWQLIVKAKTLKALLARLAPIRSLRRVAGAQVMIDVDPWQF